VVDASKYNMLLQIAVFELDAELRCRSKTRGKPSKQQPIFEAMTPQAAAAVLVPACARR
jgi:hypothetical protein